jgi:hypothetical protein
MQRPAAGEFSLTCRRVGLFALPRSSTDLMRPTHMLESNLIVD